MFLFKLLLLLAAGRFASHIPKSQLDKSRVFHFHKKRISGASRGKWEHPPETEKIVAEIWFYFLGPYKIINFLKIALKSEKLRN